ncbi:putative calcium transporter [Lophiotrema nucula]|uniref:Putative calcium transporter n=1 Tax=Lophiotrema nucula TaxID=690887 RepID=A0A6A5ZD59_9PLEO|nr:putative calcium transporter [Lophiotrema nucula]
MALSCKQIWFGSRTLSPSRDSIDSEQTAFLISAEEITLQHSRAPAKTRIDPRIVSDTIIGLSDGLTVPFALTAGLSALGNTNVVIYGGFAELIAGSISMGLGGYLGAKSEVESYKASQVDTQRKLMMHPAAVNNDVKKILDDVGVSHKLSEQVAKELTEGDEKRLLKFLMHFEHASPEPPSNRALTCAFTIAMGYFIGGFIPLLPYFWVGQDEVQRGLQWSAGIMVLTLFVFGYLKTVVVQSWEVVWKSIRGGVEMVVVGSIAAGAAMGLVVLFSRGGADAN